MNLIQYRQHNLLKKETEMLLTLIVGTIAITTILGILAWIITYLIMEV